MWVNLTKRDRQFWHDVAAFARDSARASVVEWDRQADFPIALWRALGRRGLLGLSLSGPRRGRHGVARLALALDAFAYGSKDLGIVNAWGVHTAMVGLALLESGTPALRRRLLPALASGRRIGAFALTEPDAGSDVRSMRTVARSERDGFIITGKKSFVTNGPRADVFIVIAREGEASESKFSAFAIERDTPGLRIGPAREKSCIRTSACCDIELRECQVGTDRLLGERHRAMETVVLPALDRDRCVVWAGRLGRLRNILEDATVYAARRVQFGRPIARHQGILFKIADIKARLEAAEALLSGALARLERGDSVRESAAVARQVLGEATQAAADDAMQIFGGQGFYPENHVERYHRDARLDGVGGGTTEIQKLIIGRQVLSAVDAEDAWMSETIVPDTWPPRGDRVARAARPRAAAVRRHRSAATIARV